MLDYPALLALSEIVRRGSFDAAAAALNVTPSAISQRIKGLEERIGTALIHRGPPATGTEVGLRLMRHADQVRLLEQALAADLRPPDDPPPLRIAVTADSLATWFLPVLTTLPALFDLVPDDQDHAQDWLKRGEVSAAITSHPRPPAGCDSVTLGALRYHAVASPAFAARHFPDGPDAASLRRAPAITFNQKDRLQLRWAEQIAGCRLSLPSHLIPSSEAFAEAARLGLGWGMNPEPLIADDLASGRLIPLGPPLDTPLYWQFTRLMAPALSPLTMAIRKRAADVLRPLSSW